MADKLKVNAGAWSGDLDAIVSAMLSGQGSDVDLPDPVRFRLGVHRIVLAREGDPDCDFDRPAAMVLVPTAFFEARPEGWTRFPLLHTGHYRVSGQLHFMNSKASGYARDYSGDAGELFEELEAEKVGTFPTVVYSPKADGQSKLSWYPAGISGAAQVVSFPVRLDEPTPELIAQAINGVYHGELITPDLVLDEDSPWQNAAAGWASSRAEARVQRVVRLGVQGRFPMCRVRAEIPGKDGRTDIEVVGDFGRPAGEVCNYAVIELKVLRERNYKGKPYSLQRITRHVNRGVKQAHSYAFVRKFRDRMLCCFDMRSTNIGGDVVFAPIKDQAEGLGVDLRYWFLYRSSEHFRDCTSVVPVKAG
jgi:hypothetical protein